MPDPTQSQQPVVPGSDEDYTPVGTLQPVGGGAAPQGEDYTPVGELKPVDDSFVGKTKRFGTSLVQDVKGVVGDIKQGVHDIVTSEAGRQQALLGAAAHGVGVIGAPMKGMAMTLDSARARSSYANWRAQNPTATSVPAPVLRSIQHYSDTWGDDAMSLLPKDEYGGIAPAHAEALLDAAEARNQALLHGNPSATLKGALGDIMAKKSVERLTDLHSQTVATQAHLGALIAQEYKAQYAQAMRDRGMTEGQIAAEMERLNAEKPKKADPKAMTPAMIAQADAVTKKVLSEHPELAGQAEQVGQQFNATMEDLHRWAAQGSTEAQKLLQQETATPAARTGALAENIGEMAATLPVAGGLGQRGSAALESRIPGLFKTKLIGNLVKAGIGGAALNIPGLARTATESTGVADFLHHEGTELGTNFLLMHPGLHELTTFGQGAANPIVRGLAKGTGTAIRTGVVASVPPLLGGGTPEEKAHQVAEGLPTILALELQGAGSEHAGLREYKSEIGDLISQYPDPKTAKDALDAQHAQLRQSQEELLQRIQQAPDGNGKVAFEKQLKQVHSSLMDNVRQANALEMVKGKDYLWKSKPEQPAEPEAAPTPAAQPKGYRGLAEGLAPAEQQAPMPETPAPAPEQGAVKDATAAVGRQSDRVAKKAGLPPEAPTPKPQPAQVQETLKSMGEAFPPKEVPRGTEPPAPAFEDMLEQEANQPKPTARKSFEDILNESHEGAALGKPQAHEPRELPADEVFKDATPTAPGEARLGSELVTDPEQKPGSYAWNVHRYLTDEAAGARMGVLQPPEGADVSRRANFLKDTEHLRRLSEATAKAKGMEPEQRDEVAHLAAGIYNELKAGKTVSPEMWRGFEKTVNEMTLAAKGAKAREAAATAGSSTAQEAMARNSGYAVDHGDRGKIAGAIKLTSESGPSAGKLRKNLVGALQNLGERVSGMKWADFQKAVQEKPGSEFGGLEWFPGEQGIPVPLPKRGDGAVEVPNPMGPKAHAELQARGDKAPQQETRKIQPSLTFDAQVRPEEGSRPVKFQKTSWNPREVAGWLQHLTGEKYPIGVRPVKSGGAEEPTPVPKLGYGLSEEGRGKVTQFIKGKVQEGWSKLTSTLREAGLDPTELLGNQPKAAPGKPMDQRYEDYVRARVHKQQADGIEPMRSPEEMDKFKKNQLVTRLKEPFLDAVAKGMKAGMVVTEGDLHDALVDRKGFDPAKNQLHVPVDLLQRAVHGRDLAAERPIFNQGEPGVRPVRPGELEELPRGGHEGFGGDAEDRVSRSEETGAMNETRMAKEQAALRGAKAAKAAGGQRKAQNHIIEQLYKFGVLTDEDFVKPPDHEANVENLHAKLRDDMLSGVQDPTEAQVGTADAQAAERVQSLLMDAKRTGDFVGGVNFRALSPELKELYRRVVYNQVADQIGADHVPLTPEQHELMGHIGDQNAKIGDDLVFGGEKGTPGMFPASGQSVFLNPDHPSHQAVADDLRAYDPRLQEARQEQAYYPDLGGESASKDIQDYLNKRAQDLVSDPANKTLDDYTLRRMLTDEATRIWSDKADQEGLGKEARLAVWRAAGKTDQIKAYRTKLDEIGLHIDSQFPAEGNEVADAQRQGVSTFWNNLDPALVMEANFEHRPGENVGGAAAAFDPVSRTLRLFDHWKDFLERAVGTKPTATPERQTTMAARVSAESIFHESMHFLESATGRDLAKMIRDSAAQERSTYAKENPWYQDLFLKDFANGTTHLGDYFFNRSSGYAELSPKSFAGDQAGREVGREIASRLAEHREALEQAGFKVEGKDDALAVTDPHGVKVFQPKMTPEGDVLYTVRHPAGDAYAFQNPSEFFAETGSKYLTEASEGAFSGPEEDRAKTLSSAMVSILNDMGGVLRATAAAHAEDGQPPLSQQIVARTILDAIGANRAVSADALSENRSGTTKGQGLMLATDRRLVDPNNPRFFDSHEAGRMTPEQADLALGPSATRIRQRLDGLLDDFERELQDMKDGAVSRVKEAPPAIKAKAQAFATGVSERYKNAKAASRTPYELPIKALQTLFSSDSLTPDTLTLSRMITPTVAELMGGRHADVNALSRESNTYRTVQERVNTEHAQKIRGIVRDRALEDYKTKTLPGLQEGEKPQPKVFTTTVEDKSLGRPIKYYAYVNGKGQVEHFVSQTVVDMYHMLQTGGQEVSGHLEQFPELRRELVRAIDYMKDANDTRWNNLFNTVGVDQKLLSELKDKMPLYVMQKHFVPGDVMKSVGANQDIQEAAMLDSPLGSAKSGRLEQKTFPTYKDALNSGYLPAYTNPVDALLEGGMHIDNLRLQREVLSHAMDTKLAAFTFPQNITDKENWVKMDMGGGKPMDALGFSIPKAMVTSKQAQELADQIASGNVSGLKDESGKPQKPELYVRREAAPLLNSVFGSGLQGSDLFRSIVRSNGILTALRLGGFGHLGLIGGVLGPSATLSTPLTAYQSFRANGASRAEAASRAIEAARTQALVSQAWSTGADMRDLLRTHGAKSDAQILGLSIDPRRKSLMLAMKAGGYDIADNHLRDQRGRLLLDAAWKDWGYSGLKLSEVLKKPFGGTMAVMGRAAETGIEALQRQIMTNAVAPAKLGFVTHEMENWLSSRGYDLNDPATPAKLAAEFRKGDKSIDVNQMNKIWDTADNVFGMVNYRKLFMDPKAKDALVATEQAFGWHMGDIRLMAKAAPELMGAAGRAVGTGGTPEPTRNANFIAAHVAWSAAIGQMLIAMGIAHRRQDVDIPHQIEDQLFPLLEGSKHKDLRVGSGYLGEWGEMMVHPGPATQKLILGGKSPVIDTTARLATGQESYGQSGVSPNESKYPIGNTMKLPLLTDQERKDLGAYIKRLENSEDEGDRAKAKAMRAGVEVINANQPYARQNWVQSERRGIKPMGRILMQLGFRRMKAEPFLEDDEEK